MVKLAQAKKGAATKVVSYLIECQKGTQYSDAVGHPEFDGIGNQLDWEEAGNYGDESLESPGG